MQQVEVLNEPIEKTLTTISPIWRCGELVVVEAKSFTRRSECFRLKQQDALSGACWPCAAKDDNV